MELKEKLIKIQAKIDKITIDNSIKEGESLFITNMQKNPDYTTLVNELNSYDFLVKDKPYKSELKPIILRSYLAFAKEHNQVNQDIILVGNIFFYDDFHLLT